MSDELAARRPQRRPTHPGELIREDVFPALRLKVAPAARRIGISRGHLTEVLHERKSVSTSVALRLERLTGTSAELLLSMQSAYDLWEERQEIAEDLAAIEPAAPLAPRRSLHSAPAE